MQATVHGVAKSRAQLSDFPSLLIESPQACDPASCLLCHIYLFVLGTSVSLSVMSDSLQPHGLYTVHRILQARILEWVFPSPGGFPNPGTKPRSPAL